MKGRRRKGKRPPVFLASGKFGEQPPVANTRERMVGYRVPGWEQRPGTPAWGCASAPAADGLCRLGQVTSLL